MVSEDIRFLHSPLLPGITVLSALHSERDWYVINSDYGLAVPQEWVADIRYRGRTRTFAAGEVFCTDPGEVHSTRRIQQRGTFNVIMFEPSTLADYLAEIWSQHRPFSWRFIGTPISSELALRHETVLRLINSSETPLSVQSSVCELVSSMATDLLDTSAPRVSKGGHARAVERARECLHDDDDRWIDLTTLAQKAGLSRFHLLREFKQQYGLPPHAYQIRVRIAKAQEMLRKGWRPAHVATECGFADQSHLTRHFKRVLGITPKQFFLGQG